MQNFILPTHPGVNENSRLTKKMLSELGQLCPGEVIPKLKNAGIDTKAAQEARLIHQDFVTLMSIFLKEKSRLN